VPPALQAKETTTMIRRLFSLALLLTAFWLLGACGPKVVAVGEEQNESALTMRVGSQLEIELDANPTTGYQWEVVQLDNTILEQDGDLDYRASSQLTGASGKSTFHFTAIHVGEAKVDLVYRRAWETDVAPAQTYSLQVNVRP
jgi:inhibitor of cysteine peptidase